MQILPAWAASQRLHLSWREVRTLAPFRVTDSHLPCSQSPRSCLGGRICRPFLSPPQCFAEPVGFLQFAGRSASEIDIFEATAQPAGGEISQTAQVSNASCSAAPWPLVEAASSSQWAPFNPSYTFLNRTASQVEYYDSPYETFANTYRGGAYQQVRSWPASHTHGSRAAATNLIHVREPPVFLTPTRQRTTPPPTLPCTALTTRRPTLAARARGRSPGIRRYADLPSITTSENSRSPIELYSD